jgi:hypothetical protein
VRGAAVGSGAMARGSASGPQANSASAHIQPATVACQRRRRRRV